MEKMQEKAKKSGCSRAFFQTVGSLSTREAKQHWQIHNMFPGPALSDTAIAEKLASFFNRISEQYRPVNRPQVPPVGVVIEKHEISARLKQCKKPKSRVFGDIPPELVAPNCDLLAIPLYTIYNQVISTCSWPDIWKNETVSVIPKTTSPANMGELRNLSCTPLFSKVLEFFVLKDIKNSVCLADCQYGGISGVSTDHFLVKSWDTIMSNLEDREAAASILSVDFEKAFNRMDHGECLKALAMYVEWCTLSSTTAKCRSKLGPLCPNPGLCLVDHLRAVF